jgi:AhpD family alkylhydroperoxidase
MQPYCYVIRSLKQLQTPRKSLGTSSLKDGTNPRRFAGGSWSPLKWAFWGSIISVMATVSLIQYSAASAEVREVFDDIKRTRNIEDVNNFWKALANHPPTLKRIWEQLKQVMLPGELSALTKEMIYMAVSITNSCDYCIHSHTAAARAKGMSEAQYGELLAVVGMANQTNALSTAMNVPVDAQFLVTQFKG